MGARGPKRTDTETLERRGSRLVNERKAEPSVVVAIPDCPPWVTGAAAEAWPRVCEALAENGLMSDAFQIPAAIMVNALAEYVAAKEAAEASGHTIRTPNGCKVQAPEVGIMHRASEFLLKICKEFGMTPASIAGLAKVKVKKDPLAEWKAKQKSA